MVCDFSYRMLYKYNCLAVYIWCCFINLYVWEIAWLVVLVLHIFSWIRLCTLDSHNIHLLTYLTPMHCLWWVCSLYSGSLQKRPSPFFPGSCSALDKYLSTLQLVPSILMESCRGISYLAGKKTTYRGGPGLEWLCFYGWVTTQEAPIHCYCHRWSFSNKGI